MPEIGTSACTAQPDLADHAIGVELPDSVCFSGDDPLEAGIRKLLDEPSAHDHELHVGLLRCVVHGDLRYMVIFGMGL
ncbi:MAG: hypothetical protein ACYDDU_10795 [Dermatophilaceae bacterium]